MSWSASWVWWLYLGKDLNLWVVATDWQGIPYTLLLTVLQFWVHHRFYSEVEQACECLQRETSWSDVWTSSAAALVEFPLDVRAPHPTSQPRNPPEGNCQVLLSMISTQFYAKLTETVWTWTSKSRTSLSSSPLTPWWLGTAACVWQLMLDQTLTWEQDPKNRLGQEQDPDSNRTPMKPLHSTLGLVEQTPANHFPGNS